MVSLNQLSHGKEQPVRPLLKLFIIKKITNNVFAGVQPGDYKDFKPNNPDIRVEDGTLMINNIQKTNEGYYLCEAVNGIGSGLSAVILISVQGMNNNFK